MMTVDDFLRSVRMAFRPAEVSGQVWLWLGGLGGLVLVLVLLRRLTARRKQHRAARAAFQRVLAERGLSAADEAIIRQLAARVGVTPLLVATHLEAFERATAAALAGVALPPREAPRAANDDTTGGLSARAAPPNPFAAISRLRRSLGFHVLPEHAPLLTTRELVAGAHAACGGVEARVLEVDEVCFVLAAISEGRGTFAAAATASEPVPVTITHGSEARYVARCSVLRAEPDRARLILRHDEHPERVQLRSGVRVSADGVIELWARTPSATSGPTVEAPLARGHLSDISIGGLALRTSNEVAAGTMVHVSFDWQGASYCNLSAAVIECAARPGKGHLLRLEFRALPSAEQDRLSATIAHLSARAAVER